MYVAEELYGHSVEQVFLLQGPTLQKQHAKY